MMTLVSGGAGSGKSAIAEGLVMESEALPRVYLATMQVLGEEDRQRVRRHRLLRRDKGFDTVERPNDLLGADLPEGCVVLLEDLSNLTANECFGGAGFPGAEQRILEGIAAVQNRAADLVIVTNELFSDGISYPEETARYLELLARLNCALADKADRVVEAVAGIPIWWKGEKV